MSWGDFTRLFAELTICRLRPDYVEARQGGWLPSVFGAGQALAIEVYAHTQLELAVHQEVSSTPPAPSLSSTGEEHPTPPSLSSTALIRLAPDVPQAHSSRGEGAISTLIDLGLAQGRTLCTPIPCTFRSVHC